MEPLDFEAPWPLSFMPRANLISVDPGVEGRIEVDGVLVTDRLMLGATCVSDEVERLNGFFKTGYGAWSSDGIGGASLLFLKAFRIEAKDAFLGKPVLVVAAKDGCAECEKGVPGLPAYRVVVEPAESTEAEESPRE